MTNNWSIFIHILLVNQTKHLWRENQFFFCCFLSKYWLKWLNAQKSVEFLTISNLVSLHPSSMRYNICCAGRLDLINSVWVQSVISVRVFRFFPLSALSHCVTSKRNTNNAPLCCLPLGVFAAAMCLLKRALAHTHNCIRCQWTVRRQTSNFAPYRAENLAELDVLAKQNRLMQLLLLCFLLPDWIFRKISPE